MLTSRALPWPEGAALQPGPDESLDDICGDWRIFQLRRGHRFSADDMLTAWTAAQALPGATRLLDLGSGIGSVALMTLWQMSPDATLTTLEVQRLSFDLAHRSYALNGLQDRVELRHGDLRDPENLPEGRVFDLVSGSPPYIPLGKGVVSPHPQRAGARMELKGSVVDYCAAAARTLAPKGRFAFCHAASDARPEPAIAAAGLTLLHRREVVFRDGRPPTIALFLCAWEGERREVEPFVIRDAEGQFTPQYRAMQVEMSAR